MHFRILQRWLVEIDFNQISKHVNTHTSVRTDERHTFWQQQAWTATKLENNMTQIETVESHTDILLGNLQDHKCILEIYWVKWHCLSNFKIYIFNG